MNKAIFSCMLFLCVFSVLCQQNDKLYIQHADFPLRASKSQKIDISARVVPSSKQLNWQKLEQTVFFHFGVNTFTGNEWGDGTESPDIFNPKKLNTDQWVKTVKAAGFKLVIITAKHHDGFCLWPTKTTEHSVAHSSWKNGKGDVVAELRKSCDKYGIKFGVYLSPWDRNAKCYGTEAYNDYFVAQLTELLTNYGKVDEIWFDGACGEGPNGKKQVYDFPRYYEVINKFMPDAVIAITGDDVRWVGNEAGLGRETEWSVTPLYNSGRPEGSTINKSLGIDGMSKDLGSRELVLKANSVNWWPSEVDVSIRPGWFYHSSEDSKVKNVDNLKNIYFSSVGMNSVWLLNIPPDTNGLISRNDSVVLMQFAQYKSHVFKQNMIENPLTEVWSSKAKKGSRDFNVESGRVFDIIELAEDISKGQRVERFNVQAYINGKWEMIAEGTTVGYKRLLRINPVSAKKIRVNILSTRKGSNIIRVGLYSDM